MVAAKNEENNKQTASMKTNDLTHAQVIENVNKVGQPVLKHNYKDGNYFFKKINIFLVGEKNDFCKLFCRFD